MRAKYLFENILTGDNIFIDFYFLKICTSLAKYFFQFILISDKIFIDGDPPRLPLYLPHTKLGHHPTWWRLYSLVLISYFHISSSLFFQNILIFDKNFFKL